MRILIVADAPSMHTRRWVHAWLARGHEVHVASFRAFDLQGAVVHKLPDAGLGKLGYFAAIPVLRRLAAQLHPDIAHAHYVTNYGFLAAAAGLHPLVVTAWGTDVLISPWQSRIYRYLARYALAKADRITTVAEHMNQRVVDLGGSPETVKAMPFGVDTDMFAFHPRNFAGPDRLWRIICTRNFEPIYDVATLIEAASLLRRRGRDFSLTLVGDGTLNADYQKLAAELGISDRLTFTGWVERERLLALLGEADIFVTPARSDGNNVSLNEAMAVGCFPVGTDIPANAQWLVSGRNGFLYPVGDAAALADILILSMEHPEMLDAAVIANRQIVEARANWRRSVVQMEALFEELCAQ